MTSHDRSEEIRAMQNPAVPGWRFVLLWVYLVASRAGVPATLLAWLYWR